MDPKEFSRLVARAMAERGLTTQQVADACGVSDQTVANWKNGAIKVRPRGQNAQRVARFLGFELPGDDPVGGLTDAEELLLRRIREIGVKRAGQLLWPESPPLPPGKVLDCDPLSVADYGRGGEDDQVGQPPPAENDRGKAGGRRNGR